MNKTGIFILILFILIIAIASVGAVIYTTTGSDANSNTTDNSTNVTLNGATNSTDSGNTSATTSGEKTVTWEKHNSNGTTESGYVTYDKDGKVIEGAGHEVDANGNEIGVG